jgi:hypothetical protein
LTVWLVYGIHIIYHKQCLCTFFVHVYKSYICTKESFCTICTIDPYFKFGSSIYMYFVCFIIVPLNIHFHNNTNLPSTLNCYHILLSSIHADINMLEACNVQGILLSLNSANFMHTFIYMHVHYGWSFAWSYGSWIYNYRTIVRYCSYWQIITYHNKQQCQFTKICGEIKLETIKF